MAGSGHATVTVARRPRVAIIPTGSELKPIGTPVARGDIVEYNSLVLAAQVRAVVDIPVFTTGRITDPVMAEAIVAEGRADMVGMTRAQIADPELVKKLTEGRAEDIRPCVGANVCIKRALGHSKRLGGTSSAPRRGGFILKLVSYSSRSASVKSSSNCASSIERPAIATAIDSRA